MARTSLISKIKSWIVKNKLEVLILVSILLGAFLRLYRIDEYMTFLGDEGRDAILVRRFLVNGDIMLIGPGTSIGNMYLGPLYYYMISPSLFLAGFSPTGPSIFVALVGVATIFFVFLIARKWFTPMVGLIGAFLYAISPTVIIHSHSSWNPNIMPFFSLLTLYSVWKVWEEKKYKWLVVLGASFAFVLQSHYLGVLLLPVIAVFLFLAFKKAKAKEFLAYSFFGVGVFALLMSPLVIFDIRHNWMNLRALSAFVSEPGGNFSFNFLGNIWPTFNLVITRLLAGRNEVLGAILSAFFILVLVYRFFEKSLGHTHCKFLLAWLGAGVFGLAFYQQEIYDHYFGFLFPAPYLFFAGLTQYFLERLNKFGRILLFLALAALAVANLTNNPFRYPPNRQMARARQVAEKILKESGGEKFNLAVLAERNYEDGYKYFLEVAGAEVLHADIWNKETTISDQLFVVCEKPKAECKPTTDPKAEIANFGMTQIENEWKLGGVVLYKLIHAK